MSLSTSQSPDYQPDDHRHPGGFWRWLTTDTKPPVHHHIIEHRQPRRVWALVSIVGNSVALLTGIAGGAAIVCAGMITAMVMNEHPELTRVAALYLSAKIDAWEIEHNYGCVTWPITDKDGVVVDIGRGGPDCPSLGQKSSATRPGKGNAI